MVSAEPVAAPPAVALVLPVPLLELLHPIRAARRTSPVSRVLNFIVPPRCGVGLVAKAGPPLQAALRRAGRTPSPAVVVVVLGDHPVADGAEGLDGDLD